MYTWGYIKEASLAKLDLTEQEAIRQGLYNRFAYYANEVLTQVSSAIKPKCDYAKFEVTETMIGVPLEMPSDFISFGDDVNREFVIGHDGLQDIELHDNDFMYYGYNNVVFYRTGVFYISYNARWFMFTATLDNNVELNVPMDILDCIPSYIASQCYKIEDDYKAQVFRNEYEILLSRIDATNYRNTKTLYIDGGW